MKKTAATKQRSPSIAIAYAGPEQKRQACILAEKLGLPLAVEKGNYDLMLRCSETGLEIFKPDDPLLTGKVRADFVGGTSGYRRSHGGSEILIKAIGCRKNTRTTVLDATGGFGRDAFIMASHGCRVRIAEKNPITAALLEDGLLRAANHPETRVICERISFTFGNSLDLLSGKNNAESFDVVYLDPMFPRRNKSAQVKKEQQILQELTAPEDDIENLLALALRKAGRKVVAKRPKSSSPLPGPKPSYHLGGRVIRFDIYLAEAHRNPKKS